MILTAGTPRLAINIFSMLRFIRPRFSGCLFYESCPSPLALIMPAFRMRFLIPSEPGYTQERRQNLRFEIGLQYQMHIKRRPFSNRRLTGTIEELRNRLSNILENWKI
jgi:hypothetical protein